jgi:hypothetical protein
MLGWCDVLEAGIRIAGIRIAGIRIQETGFRRQDSGDRIQETGFTTGDCRLRDCMTQNSVLRTSYSGLTIMILNLLR